MNTLELKEYAQLAQAAYGSYTPSAYQNKELLSFQIQDKDYGKFTSNEAEIFSGRYQLLHQFTEGFSGAGFSASLFRDRGGQLIFAVRGTEPTFLLSAGVELIRDLLYTDSRIGLDGYASPQVIPMYRYFKQLLTPAGSSVTYSAAELAALRAVHFDQAFSGSVHPVVASAEWLVAQAKWVALESSLLADRGIDAGQGAGVALIGANQRVDVVGHSLGGHLAILMDRLFQDKVRNIVTLNAVGLDAAIVRTGESENILKQFSPGWNNNRILRIEADGDGVSKITDYKPGNQVGIGQETFDGVLAPYTDNHAAINGADGLAVAEALGKLDSGIALDARRANSVIDAGSNTPERSYETVMEGLRRLVTGPTAGSIETGTNPLTRDALYLAIAEVDQAVGGRPMLAKGFTISSQFDASRARTDFASLVSLSVGSTLQVQTDIIGTMDALGQVHGTLYAKWNEDISALLARKDPDSLNFSDAWLADRGAMLNAIVAKNLRDESYGLAGPLDGLPPLTAYIDEASGRTAYSGGADLNFVRFGTDAAEVLPGLSKDDRLYGGAGNDDLRGVAGNDRLEGQEGDDLLKGGTGNDLLIGGKGRDTYIHASGDGRDVIVDQDGMGTIQINGGSPLPAVFKIGQGVWQSQDKSVTMTLVAQGASRNDLVITMAGSKDGLVIRDWKDGNLDLNLASAADLPGPTYALIRLGDLAKKTINDNDGDGLPEYYFDIGPNAYQTTGPEADAADVLLPSSNAGGSVYLQGLGGNDAVLGGENADYLGGYTGDDLIMGGSKGDRIVAGAGRDFVLAGASTYYYAPDTATQAADWGKPQFPTLAAGYAHGFDWATFHPSGWLVGNYLVSFMFAADDDGNVVELGADDDFAIGGQQSDVIMGDGGADTIQGGGGNDVIFGGSEDDMISADQGFHKLARFIEYGDTFLRYYNLVAPELHGNDVVDAGAGDDLVRGDGGDDILYGGTGDDILYGDMFESQFAGLDYQMVKEGDPAYHGSDYLDGGAGNDRLNGGGKDDHLIGGEGNDTLVGDSPKNELDPKYHGNDLLEGGAGDDVLWGFGGRDILQGGDGADHMEGDAPLVDLPDGHGDDTLYGGFGDDEMFGNGGNDILYGEGGDDFISGDDQEAFLGSSQLSGNDVLDGGAGMDTLTGGSGDDILIGGAGQDTLNGGDGNDTYVIGQTEIAVGFDGSTVLLMDAVFSTAGSDTIVMAGASWNALTVSTMGTGLMVSDGSYAVWVDKGQGANIQTIVTDAGSKKWGSDLINKRLTDTVVASTDRVGATLYGGMNADTLDVRAQDTGAIVAGGLGRDAINLNGNGGATVQFNRGDGMDSVRAVPRVSAQAAQASPSSAMTSLAMLSAEMGLAATDAATAPTASMNVLQLGDGIAPADLLLVWRADGTCTLSLGADEGIDLNLGATYTAPASVPAGAWPFDRIEFADGQSMAFTDLLVNRLYIQPAATEGADTVTLSPLADLYNALGGADTVASSDGADVVFGGDGDDVLSGGAGDDRLRGDDGADRLLGDAGSDNLDGGRGDDLLQGGEGDDVLWGSLGTDRLEGGEGNDSIAGGGDDGDTLYGGPGSDRYSFADGSAQAIEVDGSWDTYSVGQWLNGNGGPGYRFSITEAGGIDRLIIDNASPLDIRVTIDGNAVVLGRTNYSNGNAVRIENALGADGSINDASAIETVQFSDGTTWSWADVLARTSLATEGADQIQGLTGNDTILALGGDDIVFGGAGNDRLDGGAGFDELEGGDGNDVLIAGADGSRMWGGPGDDRYLVSANQGAVFIQSEATWRLGRENNKDPGIDSLEFDVPRASVIATVLRHDPFSTEEQDRLRLTLADGTTSVYIPLLGNSRGDDLTVDRITFADGVTLALGDLAAPKVELLADGQVLGLHGTSLGEDLVAGTALALYGYAGDDVLRAGPGGTELDGGTGNDQYFLGSGNDVVYANRGIDVLHLSASGGGSDRVRFWSEGVAPHVMETSPQTAPSGYAFAFSAGVLSQVPTGYYDFAFNGRTSTPNLTIRWNGGADSLLIENYAADYKSNMFTVRLPDLSLLSQAQVVAAANTPTAGADHLFDVMGAGSLSGGDGNDWLFGIDGRDVLDGGNGIDKIVAGYTGGSMLLGGAGDDYLLADGGNNTLDGGTGIDRVARGANYTSQVGAQTVVRVGENAYRVYLYDRETNMVVTSTYDTLLNVEYLYDSARNTALTTGDVKLDNAAAKVGQSIRLVNTLANPQGLTIASTRWQKLSGANWVDVVGAGTGTYVPVEADLGAVLRVAVRYTDPLGSGLEAYSAPTSAVVDIPQITGTSGNDTLTGTAAMERLVGLAGDDWLDGGAGPDVMRGGAGNDNYVVDDSADQVTEMVGEGVDTVRAGVTWTLGADVENLELTGTTAINGTGNALANVLKGNLAVNSLAGGAGDDWLDGAAGADNLQGGAGNDTYVVDSALDVVTEGSGTDVDTVQSAVTWTLGTNFENLTLLGTGAINGTGNTAANQILGNAAANTLDGGTGADTLRGGAGDDIYKVDNAGDQVIEALNEGVDLIQSSIAWTLGANVENLTLLGTAPINATGNDLANVLTGNSAANTLTGGIGNDTLDGGAGSDVLRGGAGDDIYVVDVATDTVTELANEGIDTVRSSVTLTLGATSNLENLTLLGTGAINGTGNGLNNVLIGNGAINSLTGGAGNDLLDGGAGADKLAGGAGDDTYVVDNSLDAITENASEGTDLVRSSVTLTLGTNLEDLALTGSSAINATGNTAANRLTGNAANNTLNGLGGNDTLDGGQGTDMLVGGAGADVYLFARGHGVDTIQDTDATAGVIDRITFAAGITSTDVTFARVTNNLEARLNGTTDKLVVKDWYLGAANQIEQIAFADGTLLTAAQVQTRAVVAAVNVAMGRERTGWLTRSRTADSAFAAVVPRDKMGGEIMVSSLDRQAQAMISIMASMGRSGDSGSLASGAVGRERFQPWSRGDIAPPVM